MRENVPYTSANVRTASDVNLLVLDVPVGGKAFDVVTNYLAGMELSLSASIHTMLSLSPLSFV